MCSVLYLSMGVISTELGQLGMIFSCFVKYGKCRRQWVLRSGFWSWGLQVRKCRPSTGNLTRSFRSLTALNLQKTSFIPLTCKTGSKNFFKLLTAHFLLLDAGVLRDGDSWASLHKHCSRATHSSD